MRTAMKKIWIITQYAAPPQYEVRIRNNAMAKYLSREGYDVTIFGASNIHNTDVNLISDGSLYIERHYDDLKYIHINSPHYKGNGLGRVFNLFVYPRNLYKTVRRLNEKPDVIINDLYATALNTPFKIGKRVHAKVITEVRDLWPQSIIDYGYIKKNGILARLLYYFEKRMYQKSDYIVYTMEGWPEYIKGRGWEKCIDLKRSKHIINGLDLDVFSEDQRTSIVDDTDLLNPSTFKVVYTGSIRRVNNLGKLLDVAKCVHTPNVRFLLWGDGDEVASIKERIIEEHIDNVIYKGKVAKKYIPFIVSHADLNFAHNENSPLFRYGISFNKVFEYLAAGKPILCDFACDYNPVIQNGAGIAVSSGSVEDIADAIDRIANMPETQVRDMENHALHAVEQYDYKMLTKKMIDVIESFC